MSVWADLSGRATVWRREATGLLREEVKFRPWVLLDAEADLRGAPRGVAWKTLQGPGQLRVLAHAEDGRLLTETILRNASQRLGRRVERVKDLGAEHALVLPPEEQYLVSSGRTYFRGLAWGDVRRMQIDLETTSLDPEQGRIFLVALRDPAGNAWTLEAEDATDQGESALIRAVIDAVAAADPDVIENHNLHGFDLPFLAARAAHLGVALELGRDGVARPKLHAQLSKRPSARGTSRFTVPGRELIDTLDAVRRHEFSARDLPGQGLKAVARHFGLATSDREYIPGKRIYEVFRTNPERVRRYATDDVKEAAGVASLLGGAAFALAQMVPRRYERLADAGPATGMIDPLLVRAYLRSRHALPAHAPGDGTLHTGAALHLFATGVAHRIVKADVASLYPSLMLQYRIGPGRDRLGVMLTLLETLVAQRLAAKARGKSAPPGSATRFEAEAMSAAMKLVVNSAYGYLGAVGLTRFADVHAANQVTARGRALLGFLCAELAKRGVTLLEADTDGVYFSVPEGLSEADERALVTEIGALLPERVRLEHDGRYRSMLSHEPKNYALMPYRGDLLLRGVAFRSRRAEPFGEAMLRRAIHALLEGDVRGVRTAFADTVFRLRRRALATGEVASRVRLTKTPDSYLAARKERRELTYEALLAAGKTTWETGKHIHVYRAIGGRAGLWSGGDDDDDSENAEATGNRAEDARDYDAEHYVRVLRQSFAARLERAFRPEDFATLFADPEQLPLFPAEIDAIRPILTLLPSPTELASPPK